MVTGSTRQSSESGRIVRVDLSGMVVQGAKGTYADYWVGLWEARAFMVNEAHTRIRDGVGRDKLGNLWLIITPILNGLMYYVIFGLVLQASKGIENFIGFLTIGIFMFTVTNRLIGQSADAIYANRSLGTGQRYSSLVKVTMVNIRVWMASFPSYLVMLLLIVLIPPSESLSPLALLLIPIILLQAGMAFGLSMIAAHLVSRVSDLKHLLALVQRGWLFSSGVFFSADRIVTILPGAAPFVDANPMYHVLDISRDVVLYDSVPGSFGWMVIGLWALLGLLGGSWILWRSEGTYSFDDN